MIRFYEVITTKNCDSNNIPTVKKPCFMRSQKIFRQLSYFAHNSGKPDQAGGKNHAGGRVASRRELFILHIFKRAPKKLE